MNLTSKKREQGLAALRDIHEAMNYESDFDVFSSKYPEAVESDLAVISDYVDDNGYYSMPARIFVSLKCFKRVL